MNKDWTIRRATKQDAPAIMHIKNHAIVSSTNVYDEESKDLSFYEQWLEDKEKGAWPVFVICPADRLNFVSGYASYGTFRNYAAYRYTIENSLYIHPDYQKRGLGKILLRQLLDSAKAEGYHLMVAVIDSENKASCHLHEQFAFQRSGSIEECGHKFGQWLDIVFYTYKLAD